MRELGPASRAIVDPAWGGDEPTHEDRVRVRRGIDARLAADPELNRDGAPTHSASASGSLAAAGKATFAMSVVAAVAAVGVASGVVRSQHRARMDDPSRKTAVSSATPNPSPSSPISESPDPPSAIPSQAVRIAPSTTTASARRWASSEATLQGKAQHDRGGVEAEVTLLGRGREAWRSGDAERALAFVNEHARRYPDGALREEREAFRITLLCALGRTQEAHEARDRFVSSFPESAHAPAATADCEDASSSF